jgi:hypothetical protein
MIPKTYKYGRCQVRTYVAADVHAGKTENKEKENYMELEKKMGTEEEVEEVEETEKEEEEQEKKLPVSETLLESSRSSSASIVQTIKTVSHTTVPCKKRKGRVTGTLNAPSKQLRGFIFPVQRAPCSSELRTSPSPRIPVRKLNDVISALEKANAAVIAARDSALAASRIADRAYSAAYDTAKSARPLVGALEAVREAQESVQDAAQK